MELSKLCGVHKTPASSEEDDICKNRLITRYYVIQGELSPSLKKNTSSMQGLLSRSKRSRELEAKEAG